METDELIEAGGKNPAKEVTSGFSKLVGSEKSSVQGCKAACKAIKTDFYHYLPALPHPAISTPESSALQRIYSQGQEPFPKCKAEPLKNCYCGLQ